MGSLSAKAIRAQKKCRPQEMYFRSMYFEYLVFFLSFRNTMSNSIIIVSLLFIGLVHGYPVVEDEVRTQNSKYVLGFPNCGCKFKV